MLVLVTWCGVVRMYVCVCGGGYSVGTSNLVWGCTYVCVCVCVGGLQCWY